MTPQPPEDRRLTNASAGEPLAPEPLAKALAAFISHASGAETSVAIDKRFVNGFSWLTYGISVTQSADGMPTDPRKLILRLGHARGLLSPYLAHPEAVVLSALSKSSVPVPPVLWHSDDPSILGAPFLVVGFAEGSETSAFGRKGEDDVARDRAIGEQFVDILAALHQFDWRSTSVANVLPICEEGDAALQQVDRWRQMIEKSGTRPLPVLQYAIRWLENNPPHSPRVTIAHGDYRAGNFLQRDGRITAVLDWELMHLGDPHADLAWASMRFLSGGQDLVSGLLPRAEFMRRYEKASGIAVSAASMRYYEVLALVKICAMNLRAVGRVERGEAPDARMTALGFGLPQLQSEIVRVLKKETP